MFGLLGFESFDLIAEILANRRVIREPSGFDFLDEQSDFDIYSGEVENVPKIPHFKQERGPAISTQVCGEVDTCGMWESGYVSFVGKCGLTSYFWERTVNICGISDLIEG